MEIIEFLKKQRVDKLYHFTDRANITSIVKNGGLFSWYNCKKKNIIVPAPGGSELSRNLDKYHHLENYVRLSFVNKHPMMFAAINDGRIEDPVILEISLNIFLELKFRFSNSNAAGNDVQLGSSTNFLKNNIRFELFTQKYFDLDTYEQQQYQAEVLIEGFIPIKFITNIADFTNSIENYGFTEDKKSIEGLNLNNHIEEPLFNPIDIDKSAAHIANEIELLSEFKVSDNTQNYNLSLPFDKKEQQKTTYNYRPKGQLAMAIVLLIFVISWISFCIYCFIFNWTDSNWYDYIGGIIIMLLGIPICACMPWYILYRILVIFHIVDSLD